MPDDNAGFAFTDLKVAYMNSDGTYAESVPLQRAIVDFGKAVTPSKSFSFRPKDFKWSFEMTMRKVNGEWVACRRNGKLYTNKMKHAMARKRDRAITRNARTR